jgi:ABC-type polysaccharide/polyol phosphate transport system ATPase subunit
MNNWAVQVQNVTKAFPSDSQRATVYRALRKQILGTAHPSHTFRALSDINFQVLRGEKIGIIGNNGSGKTTLLKVIAGLYQPSEGEVRTSGDLTLLAGLGIGMVDELSVEENVFLYGAIYGMDREHIETRLAEIIDWAELQDFAGAKLKTLSSGMRTRLAFSTTRYLEKDIYLLDEALTAGDTTFQQKCEAVFHEYKKTKKTFLISTHDMNFVKTFCTKTLWLHKGRQVEFGDPAHVVEQYEESNRD